MDPQSRPAELSSATWMAGQFGIFGPGCFAAFCVRRVHFPRAERHDRSRGGYERFGKVGVAFGLALLQPFIASRSGTEERPRRPSWLPGHPGEFDWWGLGNRVRRPLLLMCRASRGLALRVRGEFVGLPPDPS